MAVAVQTISGPLEDEKRRRAIYGGDILITHRGKWPEGGGAMDDHGLARALGWVSMGVGLAIVAAPGPLMNAIGLGDRPNLGRFLGVRDLVLGTGLLLGQNTAGWCRARGIADALDVVLIFGGAAAGAFRRDRAPIGVASGAGFSALSFWLARRLER